jgi:hypothetical protein
MLRSLTRFAVAMLGLLVPLSCATQDEAGRGSDLESQAGVKETHPLPPVVGLDYGKAKIALAKFSRSFPVAPSCLPTSGRGVLGT